MSHLVCCLVLALAVPARAAEGAEPAAAADSVRVPLEVGGLHRAAASLEILLDLYRLTLVEVVPAARRVHKAGQDPEATTATPVPEPAAEVFRRVALSVQSRVPTSALPVISRGYHAEAADALDQLSTAGTLSQVSVPLRALHRSIGRVCDTADEIIDLFSRQRPIQVKVLDPSAALEDIGEALDEVAESERNILVLRNKKAALGDQLRGFERLEVTLGHALDLIAAAEEAGLHIGFEASLVTADFSTLVGRVRAQLVELGAVLLQLEAKPHGVIGSLSVLVVETKAGREAEARLAWDPPTLEPTPAVVRIYRRADLSALTRRLALAHECEGKSAGEADTLAKAAVAPFGDKLLLVAELPAGRGAFTDALGEVPLVSPIYQVISASAFGVEGAGPEATALFAPASLEGPPMVWARSLAPAPGQPTFYRDYDAVLVSWELPQNDVASFPALERERAQAEKLTVVTGYRILRFSEGVPKVIVTLPPGTRSFVDRLRPAVISAGSLRYSVEVNGTGQQVARPPAACALSQPIKANVTDALEQALAGLGSVRRPTALERDTAVKLKDPGELAKARAAFRARPEAERAALLEAWWRSVPEARRVAWLRQWPTFVPEAERPAWLSQGASRLRPRELVLARIEIWLAEQPLEVQREVDRWWELLDADAREAATTSWIAGLDERQRRAVVERKAKNGGNFDWQSLRSARVLAWWQARDVIEQERLSQWWQAVAPEDRLAAVGDWLGRLPEADQLSVRWPDWQALTPEEQRQLLDGGWQELPDGLLAEALPTIAWLDRLQQGGPELLELIRGEVSGVTRAWLSLRYATRDADLALNFRLVHVAAAALFLFVVIGWGVRARRQRLAP
jgi:hypothetical protein